MNHSTRYSTEQERKKSAKAINQERKRDSARSDVIKTFPLYEPIIDSTVVFKTCYRQTDTQTDRQTHRQTDKSFLYRLTDPILSV